MNIRIIIPGCLGLLLFIVFIVIILRRHTKEDEDVYIRDNILTIPVKDTRYIPTITSIKMDIKDGYLSQGKQIDIEDIIIKDIKIKENQTIEYTFYVRGEYDYDDISGFENNQDYLENDGNLIEGTGEDTIGGPISGEHWCDELRMAQYLQENSPGLLDQDRLSSVNHCKTEVRKVHKAHCIIPEVDGYKKIKAELLAGNSPPINEYNTFNYDSLTEQYKILNPDRELCDQQDYNIEYHYQGEPMIEKCRLGGDEITYSGCYRSCSKLSPSQNSLKSLESLSIPDDPDTPDNPNHMPNPYFDYNKEIEEEKVCDSESTESECIRRLECPEEYFHHLDNHPRLICSTGSAEQGFYELRNGEMTDFSNTCQKGSLLPQIIRDNPDAYVVTEKGGEPWTDEEIQRKRINHLLPNEEINQNIRIECEEGHSMSGGNIYQLENCSRDGSCSSVNRDNFCTPNCSKSRDFPNLLLYNPLDIIIPSYDIFRGNVDVTCSDEAENTGESGEIYCNNTGDGFQYTLSGCYPSYCEEIKERDESSDDSDTGYVCLQKSFKIDINELEKDDFTICTNNETTNSPSEVIYQCNNSQTFTDSYNQLKDSILESSGYKDITKSNGSPLFNVNISKMQYLENNTYNVEYLIFCEGQECPDIGDDGVENSDVAIMSRPLPPTPQLPGEASMFDDIEETVTPEEEEMRNQLAQLGAQLGSSSPPPRQRRPPASRGSGRGTPPP